MAAKFVLKKGSTGKFRFNLVATNGQVIATSEAYESKASAVNGIESVKRNAPTLRSTTRPISSLRRSSTPAAISLDVGAAPRAASAAGLGEMAVDRGAADPERRGDCRHCVLPRAEHLLSDLELVGGHD